MGTKPKYKNDLTMTIRISNDFDNRKAIKQVSKNLVIINGYKNCGYDANHQKKPAMNVEVAIFCGDAKIVTQTDFSKENAPKPGDYIDVTGSVSGISTYIDSKGEARGVLRINATEVRFTEMEEVDEQAYESSESMWS